jgi:hypothetical protein
MATVVAAGGFPYHIDKSGSYRLSSDLVISGTNTNGIDIDTSAVSLDLNGFSIIGPGAQSNGTGVSIYALGPAQLYTPRASTAKRAVNVQKCAKMRAPSGVAAGP